MWSLSFGLRLSLSLSLSLSLRFCTTLNPERVSDLNFLSRFLVLWFHSIICFSSIFDPFVMGDHLLHLPHTPSSMSPPVVDRQPPSPSSASDLTCLNSQSYSSSLTVDRFKDFPSHRCLQLDAVSFRLFCLFFFAVSWKYDVGFPRYERVVCWLYFVFPFNVALGDRVVCDLFFVYWKLICLIMRDFCCFFRYF